MKHFSKTEQAQLLENGKLENHGQDYVPIARFFLKGLGGTLLVTEIRSEDTMMAYGLCDLSTEFSKVTHFNFETFADLMKRHGYELKRDAKFKGQYPISVYAKTAKRRRAVSDIQYALNKLEQTA